MTPFPKRYFVGDAVEVTVKVTAQPVLVTVVPKLVTVVVSPTVVVTVACAPIWGVVVIVTIPVREQEVTVVVPPGSWTT